MSCALKPKPRKNAPALSGRYTINLEGKGLPVTVKDVNGVSCVNVEAFAKAAGLHYKVNPTLGCADLIAPVEKSQIKDTTVAKASKKASKAAPGGPITTDGNDPKSPLRLIDMPYSDTTVAGADFAGEVRTSALIANTGKKDVQNVFISIDICNANDDSYHRWEQHVPVIKAGATFNFQPDPPMWNNYSYVTCHPKLTIIHDPLPVEEEEEAAE